MIDISWYFQGIEEFKKTVVRNTIVKILTQGDGSLVLPQDKRGRVNRDVPVFTHFD